MNTKQPEQCRCSFGARMNGDGCRHCQPQTYIDLLERQAKEHAEEAAELEAQHLQELRAYRTTVDNLEAQFAAIGAGGVSPLMGASQAQPVATMRITTPKPGARTMDLDAPTWQDLPDGSHALYLAPPPAARALDAAFEAVRQRLCGLERYSFVLDDDGVVRRVQDRVGNWIEFDAAHELFDPVAVDAAIAAQQGASNE